MSKQQLLSITVMLAAIILFGAISVSVNPIHAQQRETFSASLSGKNEVPPSKSNATGWAKFQIDDNGKKVSYWINIKDLNELTAIHLFKGSTGEDGDRVATLAGNKEGKGANNATISIKGNITKDNLEGSLNGKELSKLVSLMSNGKINVDVDTGDEFYKGEIRGRIVSGLPQMENSTTSNSTTQ